MGYVEVNLSTIAGSTQLKDELGRFTAEIKKGCEDAAERGSEIGRNEAISIFEGSGLGFTLVFSEDGHGFSCSGQWAEAAEFGIPPHAIDTEKWSLYNPEEGFPSVINERTGKPMQVQHVNHPGTPEVAMIRAAGDFVASMFEGILEAELP